MLGHSLTHCGDEEGGRAERQAKSTFNRALKRAMEKKWADKVAKNKARDDPLPLDSLREEFEHDLLADEESERDSETDPDDYETDGE